MPFKLQSSEDAGDARAGQLNSRIQLDAGYRRGWFNAQTRTVAEGGYSRSDWSGDATAYEAYLSLKPAPPLTLDARKKTFKWGKGFLWNPAAFLDRPKSPTENNTTFIADYYRNGNGYTSEEIETFSNSSTPRTTRSP